MLLKAIIQGTHEDKENRNPFSFIFYKEPPVDT